MLEVVGFLCLKRQLDVAKKGHLCLGFLCPCCADPSSDLGSVAYCPCDLRQVAYTSNVSISLFYEMPTLQNCRLEINFLEYRKLSIDCY